MSFLKKLSCFHRDHPQEIAQTYQDSLPPPKPVLTPVKVPSRFPTNVSHETAPVGRRTRIALAAPQIPPDVFTNPTVRAVSATPDSEGDSLASEGKASSEVPKSPISWLTTASDESAGSAEQATGRVPGGDLRSLPSVRLTVQDD